MFELVLLAAEPAVEALTEDLVERCHALSAAIEDADEAGPHEHALFGEPGVPVARAAWPLSRVVALFDDEASAQAAATHVLAYHAADRAVRLEALREVAEQDWVSLTQSQFDPVPITDTFWIVPSWHAVPAAATRVIRLDPGLAFGTGTHPTTRLCLRWIAQHAAALAPAWRRTLDYGCGSGVLAIAAALHGARGVDAVDIDAAAVDATRANAAANGVALRAGAPELAHGAYDLVLANILATPLRLLAPMLCAHVATAGHLVLSGILARQADDLRDAFAPWLALTVTGEDDGWILMQAQRPA
ncbi:MAG TPA: 50S ribosomal protein L11 methyltransferase [Burkholderiaceae bacterium]|nr:50S ribosomal protein L11 methyltransferase [Burkholderiaceae bacterium]